MSRPSSIIIDNRMMEHRTQSLATVFLTGRNNVEVISLRELSGLDMICRILTDEDEAEIAFDVIHGGVSGPIADVRWAEKWLHKNVPGVLKTVKKHPFPVLVLLFSMQSDEGFFSWRMEPDVSEGVPILNLNERFVCEKATRTGLDSILKRVKSWYGAYYDRMVRMVK